MENLIIAIKIGLNFNHIVVTIKREREREKDNYGPECFPFPQAQESVCFGCVLIKTS